MSETPRFLRSFRWRRVVLAAFGGFLAMGILELLIASWISVGFQWGVIHKAVHALDRTGVNYFWALWCFVPRAMLTVAAGVFIGIAEKHRPVRLGSIFSAVTCFGMLVLAPGMWLSSTVSNLAGFPLPPLAAWLVHRTRRGQAPKAGHCANCDNDLTGNVSGVCPECGLRI